MEELLRRLIGEHIRLVLVLDPGVGTIREDQSQMEQVILNLALNARDAMPGGGLLTIETKDVDIEEDSQCGSMLLRRGKYVAVTITDTGSGIEAETLMRPCGN